MGDANKMQSLTRFNSKDGAIDSLEYPDMETLEIGFNSKDGAIDSAENVSEYLVGRCFNSKDGAIDRQQRKAFTFVQTCFNSKDGAIDSIPGSPVPSGVHCVSIPKMVRLIG